MNQIIDSKVGLFVFQGLSTDVEVQGGEGDRRLLDKPGFFRIGFHIFLIVLRN